MKITFPNESCPVEAPSFKWQEFKVEKIFDEIVFGWWGDTYIKVSREDYDKYQNWVEMVRYGD